MSDGVVGTTATVPPGLNENYALNMKFILDSILERFQEFQQKYDDGVDQSRVTFNKLVTDAQNAANLALLNAVNNADLMAKQAIRHADIAASNQLVEQQQTAEITDDDINKISQAVTAAITAVLANMATGRPPANVTGAVKPATTS